MYKFYNRGCFWSRMSIEKAIEVRQDKEKAANQGRPVPITITCPYYLSLPSLTYLTISAAVSVDRIPATSSGDTSSFTWRMA